MKKVLLVLTATALLLVPSCGKLQNGTQGQELLPEPEPLPTDLTKVDMGLCQASNDFGLDVFKRIYAQKPQENAAFSPLSLSLMLAMAAEGAEGDTYAQFSKVLGWGEWTKEQLGDFYQTMLGGLAAADPEVRFTSANSYWMAAGFPFKDDYRSLLTRYFLADTYSVDFALPATLTQINDWVSDKTAGKIPVLFSEMPADAVMILINALLFQAPWVYKWEVQKGRDFQTASGEKVKKDFLYTEASFSYLDEEDYEVVSIPYGSNGRFRLDVLLPRSGKTLAQVVPGLDAKKMYAGHSGKGKIYLPMFSIESEMNNLPGILMDMGLTRPFGPDLAQFSGISSKPLHISDIVQKVQLDVTEKGTEFAAVTGGFITTAMPKEVSVDLNRPFLFQIRESQTGTVLLLGTLSN